jgi:hypothetical protein
LINHDARSSTTRELNRIKETLIISTGVSSDVVLSENGYHRRKWHGDAFRLEANGMEAQMGIQLKPAVLASSAVKVLQSYMLATVLSLQCNYVLLNK